MRIFIPSLHRAHHVPAMQSLAGDAELVWCVPEEEAEEYLASGAESVFISHPGQFQKMNEVLDAHPEEWVVFSDDDCLGAWMLGEDGELREVTLGEAAEELVRVGEARRDHYVTIGMTSNKTFLSRSVSAWAQTVNWLCAIAPGTPIRYELGGSSEVVFAAEAFDLYGRMARVNHIMAKYPAGNPESLWRDFHGGDKRPVYDEILRRFPHLFKGWKWEAGMIYRQVPKSRAEVPPLGVSRSA